MQQPPEIFQRIYARHGHRCPMSTLGGRLTVAPTGLHVLALYAGDAGVTVTLREEALATAWRYRKVDEELEAARGVRPLEELEDLLHLRSQVLQEVLGQFWTQPDDALLTMERDDAG